MLAKLIKFAALVLLTVCLGALITLTFYVAPSLFGDESGRVPNSTIAADIISPLLHKMELTAWVVLPVVALLSFVAMKLGAAGPKATLVLIVFLAAAWGASLYSGLALTPRMQEIRTEYKQELGGYHLAPDDDPRRGEFRKLHGAAMILTLAELLLGLSAMFLMTQAPATSPEQSR